jgi:hypothetical protein
MCQIIILPPSLESSSPKTLLGLLYPGDEKPTVLKMSVTIHQSTSYDIKEKTFLAK